jgi:hypothetical protein
VSARRKPPWLPLFGVVLLALVIGGGVLLYLNQQTQARAEAQAQRVDRATKVIEAVGQLDAAVGVGVNLQDYSRKLVDAAGALEAYKPDDPTGQRIRASLQKSLAYHQCAREVWQEDIEDDLGFQFFAADAPVIRDLLEKYPELSLPSSGDVDTVRQAAWVVAGSAYENAKKALAELEWHADEFVEALGPDCEHRQRTKKQHHARSTDPPTDGCARI